MIGIEPDDTFEYDLDADADTADDRAHRVLVFFHKTARHWKRHDQRLAELADRTKFKPSDHAYVDAHEALLDAAIATWRGFDRPFEPGMSVGEVLKAVELEHVAQTIVLRARLGEYEKKTSWLRSLTTSGPSAAVAGAAIAPGKTEPPSPISPASDAGGAMSIAAPAAEPAPGS